MIYHKHTGDSRYNKDNGEAPFNFKKDPLHKWSESKTTIQCQCCGTLRNPDAFPAIPGNTWCNVDPEGRPRAIFCLGCLEAMYKYFTTIDPEHDVYKSIYRICMLTSIYYDDRIAHKVLTEPGFYEDGTVVPESMGPVDRYIRSIMDNPDLSKKQFWDSDNLVMKDVLKFQYDTGSLSKQGQENRTQILTIFHDDPFENEELEDREKMYNDLVTMMDDAMTDDLVRQKSAIEIVRAFKRIDKLSEAIRELQKTPESIIEHDKQLKTLIEQKSKETALVTSFSKDHGFAEKYALSKSKGSGTLSAIVRDMKESHYDPGIINKYDIETSAAIKQISDISAESIFKQIGLSDSEYSDMVKQQADEIIKLRDERDRTAEELRMFKEKHLKQSILEELEKELKQKGISDADVSMIINREINK